MSLTLPTDTISPLKQELTNMISVLEEQAAPYPQLQPHLAPIRTAVNMRVRNPRHRVSADEFVGLNERINVLLYASEEMEHFKDKPEELKTLTSRLDALNNV